MMLFPSNLLFTTLTIYALEPPNEAPPLLDQSCRPNADSPLHCWELMKEFELLAIQHKTCLLQNLNLNERGWKCKSSLLGSITPFLKDLLLKQDEYSKIYDRKLRITNNKFDQTTDKLKIIDETLSENKRNATEAISNSDKKIQNINERIKKIENQLSSTVPAASHKFDETPENKRKIENFTEASS